MRGNGIQFVVPSNKKLVSGIDFMIGIFYELIIFIVHDFAGVVSVNFSFVVNIGVATNADSVASTQTAGVDMIFELGVILYDLDDQVRCRYT